MQKIKHKYFLRFKKQFHHIMNNFCEETTLHGIRYLNEQNQRNERIFFGLAFIATVLGSVYFLTETFLDWRSTPFLISRDSVPTQIKDEPFPAVTICNLNQAMKNKVQHFPKNSQEYAMLQLICKRDFNLTIASSINDWNTLIEFLRNITQTCEELIIGCQFASVEFKCSDFFQTIVNDEGVCCEFNRAHLKFLAKNYAANNPNMRGEFEAVDWNPDNGYPKELPNKYYPREAAGVGQTLGLSITLNADFDNYYCSSMNSIGFKIGLNNPIEYPIMSERGILIAPGREIVLPVIAERTKSSPTIRNINTRYRNCYFQDEVKLNIFRYYSSNTCLRECMARKYVKFCGCVPYDHDRRVWNLTICSLFNMSCIRDINFSHSTCVEECLPNCNTLSYTYDIWSAPMTGGGFKIANNIVSNMSSDYVQQNIARLHIYFAYAKYRANIFTQFVPDREFLSTVGGLLNLFYGLSVISLVEILYLTCLLPLLYFNKSKTAVGVIKVKEGEVIKPAKKLFKIKQPVFNRFKQPYARSCRVYNNSEYNNFTYVP